MTQAVHLSSFDGRNSDGSQNDGGFLVVFDGGNSVGNRNLREEILLLRRFLLGWRTKLSGGPN